MIAATILPQADVLHQPAVVVFITACISPLGIHSLEIYPDKLEREICLNFLLQSLPDLAKRATIPTNRAGKLA